MNNQSFSLMYMFELRRLGIVIALIFKLTIASAQPFYKVGSGTDYPILSLYADSVNNILYAGGEFSQAGGIQCHSIATWDGTDWDSTRNQLLYPGFDQVRGITKFNNEIYIAGPFGMQDTAGSYINTGIAKWDTSISSWINLGANPNQSIQSVYSYNNTLYALGLFDTIGGIYSTKIVGYDGTNWNPFPPLDTNSGYAILAAMAYNGDLYVGENFNGQISNTQNLAKWNGTQWMSVGTGVNGSWVNDFTIYQGKLIVAGLFYTLSGSPGNDIAAWDGTSWSQFGTGITGGQVWDVEVYNGELWAGGAFSFAGGNPAEYLAKWDGTQWQNLGITLDNAVTSMAVVGNDLYIAGGFWTMDGDSVNRIIRYNSHTGFEALSSQKNNLEIFPNPFVDKLTIKTNNNEISEITLYDLSSRKLFQQQFTNTVTLNTALLTKGMYLYEVKTKNGVVKKGKVVKE